MISQHINSRRRLFSKTSGRAWLPSDLTLQGWWPSDETGLLTPATGNVSQFDDKSENGYNLTQSTSANRPESGNRQVNNLNVVDFDGSEYMESTTFQMPPSGNVIVAHMVVIDSASGLLESINSWQAGEDYQIQASESDPTTQWLGRLNTTMGSTFNLTNGPFNGLTLVVIRFDWTGNMMYVRVNGVNEGSGAYNDQISTNGSYFSMMSNRNQSARINGASCELIVADSNLLADVQKLEGYVVHKWDNGGLLPVDHPYKAGPPTI